MLKNITINLFDKEIKLDLKQVNIFSGYNGSGKTYLLDELTSLLYTNEDTYFKFINKDSDLTDLLYNTLKSYYRITKGKKERYNKIFISVIEKYAKEKSNIFLSDSNSFMDLESYVKLAQGQLRLLVLLTTTFILSRRRETNKVFIIDDIETNLHFDIQKDLINDMISICPDIQIICSTHSPTIIMNGWRDCVREMSDVLK